VRLPDLRTAGSTTMGSASALPWSGSPIGLFVALLFGLVACSGPDPDTSSLLRMEIGVDHDGVASPTWIAGMATGMDPAQAAALGAESHPFTATERAWIVVLERALPVVVARADELAEPFRIEPFPMIVTVGNRSGRDGFGWKPDHLAIDVEAFTAVYGSPDEDALDRMQRILAHEYVHLLTYAAFRDRQVKSATPLDRALWTMFFEGMVDYYSASKRWRPGSDGRDSPASAEALARLEPVLVERLEALASASPSDEPALREGISMGRFDHHWGSLPVAIWLHKEARQRGSRVVLQEYVSLGRAGILPLALRHVAPELRPRVSALMQ